MKRAAKFFHLSFKEQLLIFDAFFWLLLAKIVLLILPFRKIVPLLKSKVQLANSTNSTELTIQIRDSIARAGTATPFKSTCLIKSMAARWMLNRRQISSLLSIGMRKTENGNLEMHAWIVSGSNDIVKGSETFQELFVLA